jgi:hypothetical protein
MLPKIRIIDNKKVSLVDDEFNYYVKICRDYDRANFKGEQLFIDHFEANEDGIILFVKPPTKKYSSLEVYCFLISLMVNQHLRLCHSQIDSLVKETKQVLISEIKKFVEDSSKKSDSV